jgi:tetrapyrrole methylase family protein/MazG family protein
MPKRAILASKCNYARGLIKQNLSILSDKVKGKRMLAIEELIKIMNRLLGPNGCPWDQAQTMLSMRSSLLEESCEVIDAIDSCDNSHIKEELGDLLFNTLFLCLLAEKEEKASLQEIVQNLNDKLIYRHPHVFGEGDRMATSEAVLEQWDRIKTTEKGKETRESSLDGIPKALPSLARAQKVLKKMKKQNYTPDMQDKSSQEIALGNSLLQLVMEAEAKSVEAEFALRHVLEKAETAFRVHEKNK